MYQRKVFMDHLPMIIIVSGYNMDRKRSMANNEWSKWVTTYLCENPRRSSQKESVPDINILIVIWDVMIAMDFPPILCWLGNFLMSLERNLVLWWYHTRFALGRDVCLSATGLMLRSWHRFSASGMSGTPFWQMYAVAAVCYIVLFPVEIDSPLP